MMGVRKKWQSKLQHTKRHVLQRCLAIFSRVLSFRKKQGKNPEVPADIVEEILHRIPAKYLVRWKRVSKQWKSLIESSHLAEKHLNRRKKLYGAEEYKITFVGSNWRGGFRMKFYSRYDRLIANNRESEEEAPRVVGSCNGLVCVFDLVDVYIVNPMTCVIRALVRLKGTTILSAGFGRDVVTRAYKVTALCRFDDGRVETLVLDLSTSVWRWRYNTAGPMPLSGTLINNPVFVNGSLFWLLARDPWEILVMDLHTEKFRTMSLPKDISGSFSYMWSLKDRLCVSDLRQGLESDVWILLQDELGERWDRTRFAPGTVIPPLMLNSAWFSPTLVSPYQSSSSSSSFTAHSSTFKACEALALDHII